MIKLISLNIEHGKHLDLVTQFLAREMPDAVCLQELFEHDASRFAKTLRAQYFFAPMTSFTGQTDSGVMGVGIFSRLPIQEQNIEWYRGDPSVLPELDYRGEETFNNKNLALLHCDIKYAGEIFRIATTHFTWTRDGSADDQQRHDIQKLLGALEKIGEFVLTGDFNAPRGGEIFSMLASEYKDNVPAKYTTSLDISLHREGKRRPEQLMHKMVDGLFSTPRYKVSDVELISGVSDHMAIKATVSAAI